MTALDDESFIQRWLRRKSDAARGDKRAANAEPAIAPQDVAPSDDPGEEPVPPAGAGDADPGAGDPDAGPATELPTNATQAAETQAADADRPITDADLPDLETLDENADYSMFMAAGISPGKRQAALRQLFRGPKFNVTDGLDDYCEDFTKFEPLGDLVTADMRHHAERLARKALGIDDDADESDRADEAGAETLASGAAGTESDDETGTPSITPEQVAASEQTTADDDEADNNENKEQRDA